MSIHVLQNKLELSIYSKVKKWLAKHPGYEVITSSSERSKTYSDEVELLIKLKLLGYSDKDVGELLNRSYWSVVYKWKEIKKASIALIEKNAK